MNNGDIKDKDRYLMLIPIITLVIIIIGGTYAFMESVYFKDSIVGTLDCYTVNYTKGQDVEGELNLGTDYTSGKSTDIVMYSDPDCAQLTGRLYITTNNISTMDFSDNALRYTVVVDGNIVSEGAVDGTANQVIYENFTLNTTATTYKVYVWLSSELEDTSNKDDETYSGFIHAEAVAKSDVLTSGPNTPDLANNSLVPVYYDESASTWKVASYTNENNNWYNYDEKKWANAVLLTEGKRNSLTKDVNGNYQVNQVIGDTESSGTLAFYVWIPRYKYKVWNIDKIADSSVYTYDAYTKGVDIVFESADEKTGTITCNYSYRVPSANAGEPNEECIDTQNGEGYYTHPAFTFGNDELSGFWMGKFELSSEDQTIENYGGADSTYLEPRILPDVISWRYNDVDNFWKVIYDMQKENNIYGLPIERIKTDSHMLTNMEWGAVAYLAHSKYGRCTDGENSTCTEVAKNNSGETNNYTNYTGRSSGVGGSDNWIDTGTYTYDGRNASTNEFVSDRSLGAEASTTGNIYGVYDMSGGGYEYVMGNTGSTAGEYSGPDSENYTYEGFEKYLTTYAYDSTSELGQIAYNRGRLGDATSEVLLLESQTGGWYEDLTHFPYNEHSWFLRGGDFYSDPIAAAAGIFNFYYDDGERFSSSIPLNFGDDSDSILVPLNLINTDNVRMIPVVGGNSYVFYTSRAALSCVAS